MTLARIADEGDRRVAHNLRRLRRGRALSLADVGAALGVTYQSVHKMEAGQIRLRPSTLAACAWLFHVSVDAFFEPLEAGAAALRQPRRPVHAGELEAILAAFNRIADPDQRRALLTAARALAGD